MIPSPYLVFLGDTTEAIFAKTAEPGHDYLIPFGKARTVRAGEHVTAVSWGSGVIRCAQTAEELASEGISVEVIDLRTLVPLDEETVVASVRKTGRMIVVHEAVRTGGFGGEVVARIVERCFADLDAPVRRYTAPDCFPPYAPELEAAVLPGREGLTQAIRELARW